MNVCRICLRPLPEQGAGPLSAHSSCLIRSMLFSPPPQSASEIERLICKFRLRPYDLARRYVTLSSRYGFFKARTFGACAWPDPRGSLALDECVRNGDGQSALFPLLGKRAGAMIFDLPQSMFNSGILQTINAQLGIRHTVQDVLPRCVPALRSENLENLDFASMFHRAIKLSRDMFGNAHKLTLRQQLFFLLKYDPMFAYRASRLGQDRGVPSLVNQIVPLTESKQFRSLYIGILIKLEVWPWNEIGGWDIGL